MPLVLIPLAGLLFLPLIPKLTDFNLDFKKSSDYSTVEGVDGKGDMSIFSDENKKVVKMGIFASIFLFFERLSKKFAEKLDNNYFFFFVFFLIFGFFYKILRGKK